jgi:murein DD-endopeptidase MepM/ murein hydrolase activator NlpD
MEQADRTQKFRQGKRHWHGKHSVIRITTLVASIVIVTTIALRLYLIGHFVHDVQRVEPILVEKTPPPAITLPPQPSWHEFIIKKGDTLLALLSHYKIQREDVIAILNLPRAQTFLNNLQPKHQVKFSIDDEGHLQEFMYQIKPTKALIIQRGQSGFSVQFKEQPLETQLVYRFGTIDRTLSHAAKKYHLPQKIVMELEQILGWKVNFNRDIRPGDQFKIIYQQHFVGDQAISIGNIVAIEFINKGTTYQAVRFTAPDGKTGYYTPEGKSLQKAFLRFPVEYTRISSPFDPHRLHPILNTRRPHLGVDLAAPYGTPVKASGDGKISLAGLNGGYGNAVIIDHGNQITTLYGHLRRIAKGLKKGAHVKQGEVIGYVGSTGLATGPHLHYEFRINNQHQNAITVKLPPSQPVDKAYQAEFNVIAAKRLAQLDNYSKIQVAEVKQHTASPT